MSETIIDCAIALVNVNGRFRKDFGDIPALAESIKELGLLQPIGIDSAYRLVFGERRLRAFKYLGRDTIPARFVNLDSLMKGELAENEFRKEFTVSERIAIGEAIERELQGRNGIRHDTKPAKENFPEVAGQTRDIAAKAAGFGNGKTYEQAKKVSNEAAPELVQAMDEGRASVSAAASLLALPKDQQAAAATGDKKAIKQAVKAAKGARVEPVKPAGSEHVLRVINAMDLLARHALREGMSADRLANKFLDEVDATHPVIADRLAATQPFMAALGCISDKLAGEIVTARATAVPASPPPQPTEESPADFMQRYALEMWRALDVAMSALGCKTNAELAQKVAQGIDEAEPEQLVLLDRVLFDLQAIVQMRATY